MKKRLLWRYDRQGNLPRQYYRCYIKTEKDKTAKIKTKLIKGEVPDHWGDGTVVGNMDDLVKVVKWMIDYG